MFKLNIKRIYMDKETFRRIVERHTFEDKCVWMKQIVNLIYGMNLTDSQYAHAMACMDIIAFSTGLEEFKHQKEGYFNEFKLRRLS